MKTIREVSREREASVYYQTQNKNRLHFYLTKVYLGTYKDFFSRLDGKLSLEFFIRYPLPQSLKNVDAEELSEFFYKIVRCKMKKKAEFILKAVRFLKEQEITEEQQFLGETIKHLATIIREAKTMIKKSASQYSSISKRYYRGLIARGLSKREALKRLAWRISDILYTMMRNGTEYDPERVIMKIRRRRG